MDAGNVAEFAPPQELLANPNSLFAGLVREWESEQKKESRA
jgi:hypothetical protein